MESDDGKGGLSLTEAEVFYDQGKKLASLSSVQLSDDYLYDGILYYRVKSSFFYIFILKSTFSKLFLLVQMGNEFNRQRETFSLPNKVSDEHIWSPLGQSDSRRQAVTKEKPRRLTTLSQQQHKLEKLVDVDIARLVDVGKEADNARSRKKSNDAKDQLDSDVFDHRSAILRALHSTYIGYDRTDILDRIGTSQSSRPQSRQDGNPSKIIQHREAQDKLLYSQLKLGIIPEKLFKKTIDRNIFQTLDLSYFGLGDEMGQCLGSR